MQNELNYEETGNVEQRLKSKSKTFAGYFLLFLLLMVTYFLLLTLACRVPNANVKKNVLASVNDITGRELNGWTVIESNSTWRDTFSDGIMLNMTYAVDSINPVRSAIQANQLNEGHSASVFQNLNALGDPKAKKVLWSYGRYWHGWLTVVRPLFSFLKYSEILYLNTITMSLLFIAFMIFVYRRLKRKAVLAMGLGFGLINFWLIPLCMQYSGVFIITLVFSMIIMMNKSESNKFGYIFFICGSLTCFVDLLSVPVVSLGIPLIVLISMRSEEGFYKSFKHIFKDVIVLSMLWIAGYGFTWAFKFFLLFILGETNTLKEAWDFVAIRSGVSVNGKPVTMAERLANIAVNFNCLDLQRLGEIAVAGCIILAVCLFAGFNKSRMKQAAGLLLAGCLPFANYIVLGNHSQAHFWFTCRLLIITIVAVFMAIFCLIDTQLIRKRLLNLKFKKPENNLDEFNRESECGPEKDGEGQESESREQENQESESLLI